jgi:GNAT superfamily N-acetyltransferase
MSAARPIITLAEEDPLSADSLALDAEMGVFVDATYPEDAELGIVPTTPQEMARDGLVVIARVGGAAAGCACLMKHPPVDGVVAMEVKRVLVRPDFRGLGLAKQLMARLDEIARGREVEKLVLMCGPRQPEALKLYEQCGYARRSAYGKHSENWLSIFFEKRL